MKNYFVIGVGGCGNKVVSQGVSSGIISKNNYLLMNSTNKDVPDGFKSIIFSDDGDYGCAKNRAASKALFTQWLKNGGADTLSDTIAEDVDCVIVINSTEGGTGSGAADIICKFIAEDLGVPSVINIPIFGFADSTAGCLNSLEYMKDFGENIAILPFSNSKAQKTFETVGVNTFKTEKQVNDLVLKQVAAILGQDIKASDQNIDAADHLAIIGNPGLMFISTIDLTDIRDINKFNSAIISSIAQSIGFDIDPSLTTSRAKMGIYLNITEGRLDYIGNDFSALKKRLFGDYTPSSFLHKQYDAAYGEFARVIISGLEIPINEATKLKSSIEQESIKSTNGNSFFDQIGDINVQVEDAPRRRRASSGGSFLDSLDSTPVTANAETEQVLANRGSNRSTRRMAPRATSTTAQAPAKSNVATSSGSPLVSNNGGKKQIISQ